MRPLENHQVADHAAVSHDPSWLKGAAAATQSEVTLGGGDASGSDLPIPRQAAFDTVKSFVDADDYGFAKNTDAIAGAIFGDLQAKRTADELILIEQIIKEVIEGAAMPKVQVVGNGNIYASTQETLLPDGVLGAFVPGGPGEAGTILISKNIQDRPDLLADVMLEEVGEAVGDHVHHELSVHPSYDYGDPAPGDVGSRIMQVVRGKPVDEVAFEVTDGGLKEDAPDFDPERDYDERYVMFDSAVVAAKTAANEEAAAEALAAAWGVEDPDAADLFDINDAVAKANDLQNGPPWTVESYANIYDFDLVVAHYSADGSMTINEIAHAIFDGAVDLETADADADGNGLVVTNVDESKLADRTDQELADEWGVTVEVLTAARADANEIYTRNNFTGESGFTEGDNDANGWDTMIRVYGQEEAISGLGDSGPVLQVDEMARAIAEGAVTTTVNSNGVVFDAVDLPQISNLALTDAIWLHSEANSQDGGQRVQMPVDLLADSVAAITGDTDGFITDADKALIQDKYADVYFGDVPEPNRFSKDAVQRIWDTEGFMRASEEPGIFNFRVNAENVEAADPAVPIGGPGEPTDPDDPGLIGEGKSAWGIPANAVNLTSVELHPEQNHTGHHVYQATYNLADDLDTTYIVLIDAADLNGAVLHSTVFDNVTGDAQMFHLDGTLLASWNKDILEASMVDKAPPSGQDELAVLETWAEEQGVEITSSIATSKTAMIVYDDEEAMKVAYINIFEDADGNVTTSGDEPIVANYTSEAGLAQMRAAIHAWEGDEEYRNGSDGARSVIAWDKVAMVAGIAIAAGAVAVVASPLIIGYAAFATVSYAAIAGIGAAGGAVAYGGAIHHALADGERQNAVNHNDPDGVNEDDLNPTTGTTIADTTKPDTAAEAGAPAFDITEANPDHQAGVRAEDEGGFGVIDGRSHLDPTAADETDEGVLGLDRPAYFRPQDAELVSSVLVPAEDGPYGVLTEQFTYTRPGEDNTVYVVSVDRSDPGGARDGLVLHGTKTVSRKETDGTTLSNVTSYDSFGTVTETVNDLDLAAQVETMTEEELLGHPDENIVHIKEQILEFQPDADILETHSSGPLAYGTYKIPGEAGIKMYMVERVEGEDGGHSYEFSDDWLSSPVAQAFVSAFGYFQLAVNTFVQLKRYYDAGVLADDVFNYLSEYFLQDVNFAGILASMFPASGAGTGGLPPEQAATVRHVGAAAAAIPLIARGVALTIDQMWATRGGASNIGMAMMNLDMADGQEDGAGLQGENGDIEAPAAADLPGPATPPTPPDDMEIEGTELLLASTNPEDMCDGVAGHYLMNRIGSADGLAVGDSIDTRLEAYNAAPIENGVANQAAEDLTGIGVDVENKLGANAAYFMKMSNANDQTVTDILEPAGQTDDRYERTVERYQIATPLAKSGLDVTFSPSTNDINDVLTKINETPGKAFYLGQYWLDADDDHTSIGHARSIVKEWDGSVTVMDANDGVIRFAPDDPNLLTQLSEDPAPSADTVETVFQLVEVKSTDEASNGMSVTATQITDLYDALPNEAPESDEDEL